MRASTSSATLTKIVPPMVVIMLLIALWWIAVVRNDSAIFPTPWQVVTGALELARDGTLWQHIGASLFRVGIGFGLAFLVAVPSASGSVGSAARIARSTRSSRCCGRFRLSRGHHCSRARTGPALVV